MTTEASLDAATEATPACRTLSLVFPVYMNEGSLSPLFAEIRTFEEQLAKLGLQVEVIFVDDGSTDDSFTELLKVKVMRPATKIVRLSRNFGAVAASKTGLKFVTGDCFVIVAADQQDPLEQVLLMAKHWLDGCKFVVSARLSRADPRVTRGLSAVYYAAVRLLVTSNYPRGGFDLMLMDRSMLPYMSQSARNINPNMYAIWLGIPPRILYYNRRRRLHGKSRWTLRKKLNFFIDTMTGFSVVPIRLLSGVGVLIAVLSFAYGSYMLAAGLMGRFTVTGFATIIVLTTFLFGLVLVMLGIIGEYLWRLFDIVSGKPESVIAETYL